MTHEYVLMSRTEDASKHNMPTLQFVDPSDPDNWLIIMGTDLFRREANRGGKMTPGAADGGAQKKYRITIEEV